MNYKLIENFKYDEWSIVEDKFDENSLSKTEAIFSQGNGYLGIRAASEEEYVNRKHGLFINGTYDKFKDEVSELPNAADILRVDIEINDIKFNLLNGTIKLYSKKINLKTGELIREVHWVSPIGDEVKLIFSRFTSLEDNHLIGQKIRIKACNKNMKIKILTGIDGRITNSGTQHFQEISYRMYNLKDIFMKTQTQESKVLFYYTQFNSIYRDGKKMDNEWELFGDRRQAFINTSFYINVDETIELEKMTFINTSKDLKFVKTKDDEIFRTTKNILSLNRYDDEFEKSIKIWGEYWKSSKIKIIQKEEIFNMDQLAINFAKYHLKIMTPQNDNRLNVPAKGLSGEGYKGHYFWDTEMFILPYYIWQNPIIARKLLENRFLGLKAARKKANMNGYKGAMYPWEVAWYKDGEATPIWGAPDILTGERTKIWSGFIEQHITSCVAYGVINYLNVTNDIEFMEKYGYEIMISTAQFWVSRLEWKTNKKRYEITNVVGPDEYKEHVDNNAFTNYMAFWTIKKSLEILNELKSTKTKLYDKLNKKIDIENDLLNWNNLLHLIYLPNLNEEGLIPQDDNYLTYPKIDLTNYKNAQNVGTLFKEYSLSQVNKMQVSKQTDVLFLFYILEDLWDNQTKKHNFEYYEAKTLHDSSLSLSTHTILASDIKDQELAYKLFQRSFRIDLLGNMKTSNDGIHAASMGGICISTIFGFAGLRIYKNTLRINPCIPIEWESLELSFWFKKNKYWLKISNTNIVLKSDKISNDKVIINDEIHILNKKIIEIKI